MESLYEGIVLNNPNLIEKMTGKGTVTQLNNGNAQLQANVIINGNPKRIRKQFNSMEDAQKALDNMRSRWFVSNHVERNFAKYTNEKQIPVDKINGTVSGAILEQTFANAHVSTILAQSSLNNTKAIVDLKESVDENTNAVKALIKMFTGNYVPNNNVVNTAHNQALVENSTNANVPKEYDNSLNEKFWKLLYGADYINKMSLKPVLCKAYDKNNPGKKNDYYTISQTTNCKSFYERLCNAKRKYRMDAQKDKYFIPNTMSDLENCSRGNGHKLYDDDFKNNVYKPNEIYTFRLKCSFYKSNGLGYQKSQNKRIKNQFIDFVKHANALVKPNAIVESEDALTLYFVFHQDFVNATDFDRFEDLQNRLFKRYVSELYKYKQNNSNVHGQIHNVSLSEPTYLPYSLSTKMTTRLEMHRVTIREVGSIYEMSQFIQNI